MGRLIYLELKRVVTTKSTWVILTIMLLLSALMAYFPISYVRAYQVSGQGDVKECSGKAAIACLKQEEQELNGEITEEKIRQAIIVFRECYQQYGSIFPPGMSEKEYVENIVPIYPILKMAAGVLAPEDTNLYMMSDADLDPEDAGKFYKQYRERLIEKGKGEAEQEKIRMLNEKMETPFLYASGFSSESFDYLALYILLLLLAFVIIISPIFSAEYQTGADSILRCTKNGRIQLAGVKIIVSVLLFAVTFIIGTGSFLLVTNLTFGAEGLKTSVQMLNAVFVIPGLTIGEAQVIASAGGFLSIFAMVSCTLYLSARCKNVQDSLKISIVISLLPTILYMISSANPVNAVRCILPSGGIGLMNSFLYELLGNDFVHIGPAVIWRPYLIIGAAVIEIPLFLVLTVRAYCRRESV